MKPILVTGGAKGLGAEICKQLAARGHDIVVHFRSSESEASAIADACRAYGVEAKTAHGDFTTSASAEAFIDAYSDCFPETKGLVNNVGNYLIAPSTQTDPTQWRALFQTNFFTPIALIQGLLPALKQAQGRIVNIGTSGLSSIKAIAHAPAYAATKSALWFYTRSLAKELASDHVSVNMVSPGYLETSIDLNEAPPLPMGRPATLKEAAEATAFFFEAANHYITGQNLEVAGGFGL